MKLTRGKAILFMIAFALLSSIGVNDAYSAPVEVPHHHAN